MTHFHLLLDEFAKQHLTGVVILTFEAGCVTKIEKTQVIEAGPHKAVWPPAVETRGGPTAQSAPVEMEKRRA